MAGDEPVEPADREDRRVVAAVGGAGREHVGDMVAGRMAVEHGSGEPVASRQDRAPTGTGLPGEVPELVDVVARLGGEAAREVVVALPEHVDHERRRASRARRVVWLSAESQTPKRSGSRLHCVAKATRQPACSPCAVAVHDECR